MRRLYAVSQRSLSVGFDSREVRRVESDLHAAVGERLQR